MPDYDLVQGQSVPAGMVTKWKDMGDGTHAQVVAAQATVTDPLIVGDSWRVELASDTDPNSNDKLLIVVPGGEEIQILWIYVDYTSDANVGDRQLEVEVQSADTTVKAEFLAGAVQAASLARRYMFAPALADLTGFRDTFWLMSPLPPSLILRAGDRLRIYDNNLVSAGDDMVVRVQYAEREI